MLLLGVEFFELTVYILGEGVYNIKVEGISKII